MDKIIYMLCLVLFSTFIISCSNEITEQNKNDLERFEIEWTSHLELGDYFRQELMEFENKLKIVISDSTIDTAQIKNEIQLKNQFESEINSLKKKYDFYSKKCKKMNQDWIEFKSRAMNDEISKDESESKKMELDQILEDYKKELKEMFYELDQMKVKSNE